MQSSRASGSRLLQNLLIALLSLVLTLAVCEVVVRLVGKQDENGAFTFNRMPVRPYRLDIERVESILNQYSASSTSYVMYDPYLGWTHRPNSQSENGLYRANSAGLRADRDYDPYPADGVLRIALFGDSFTHSSDVAYQDSWSYQLERLLRENGIEAEVLNFGTGGYGMDQAYLRWQYQGRDFHPHLVIFGFLAENAYRNLNVVRSIYEPLTQNPFTKPRFVLADGELQLVNSPTVPPDQIIPLLENFADSPLRQYEYFYNEGYVDHWYLQSKLLAVALSVQDRRWRSTIKDRSEFLRLDGDAAQLALAIIAAFEADARAHNAEFMILYLPLQSDLGDLYRGRPHEYADLLNYLDQHHTVIHAEGGFDLERRGEYYLPHFNPEGNLILARAVFDAVLGWLMTEPDQAPGGISLP